MAHACLKMSARKPLLRPFKSAQTTSNNPDLGTFYPRVPFSNILFAVQNVEKYEVYS